MTDVGFGRAFGYAQLAGDLMGGLFLGEQAQYLVFARAET